MKCQPALLGITLGPAEWRAPCVHLAENVAPGLTPPSLAKPSLESVGHRLRELVADSNLAVTAAHNLQCAFPAALPLCAAASGEVDASSQDPSTSAYALLCARIPNCVVA